MSILLYSTSQAQVFCNASFTVVPDSSGYGFTFQNTSTGGYTSSSWNLGNGTTSTQSNATAYYNASGYYVVCLSISGLNCQSTYCDSVYAGAPGSCLASFSAYTNPGTLVVNFTNLSSGSSMYSWNFGDGGSSTLQNPVHTYNQAGVYTTCLTISNANGCSDTYCGAVTINANTNCNAGFASYDTSGYNFFIADVYVPTLNYFWDFGDGSTGSGYFLNHQYSQPGLYVACLTVFDSLNACSATQCDTVLAAGSNNGTCSAQFTTTYNGNGSITFNPPVNSPNSYFAWNFGDGTSSTLVNPTHTYSSAGVFSVCLTVTNFAQTCTDYYCAFVQTSGTNNCDASFGTADSGGYVFFYPNNFSSTSYYSWTFGDGGTGTGVYPVHQYSTPGYYTICCTISDSALNCSATWCDSIYAGGIFGNCQAAINFGTQLLTANFYGYSNNVTVVAWTWDFGDGTSSTLQNPSHTYLSSGYYVACLTITTNLGCVNTVCQTVQVTGTYCDAQFQAYDSAGVYYFFPNTTGALLNYYWDFGDNTVSTSPYPVHQYSGNGPWITCLTITDSANFCTATWCDTLYSNNGGGSCQAYFSASPDSSNGVQFFNLSGGNYTSFYWSFGDGTSSTNQNPYHQYANPGSYIVCITIYGNNCQDSYCDSVIIGSGVNCVPQFYTYPDSTLGSGNMNFNLLNSCPGWTYSWSFGDNTAPVAGLNPAHQYNATGWYTVCVDATDPNGNVITWCDSIYAFRVLFTGLENHHGSSLSATVFPNPSRGPVTLRYTLPVSTQVTIQLMSIEGKVLYSTTENQSSGIRELQISTNDFASGIYLVRLHAGDQDANLKIIVQ